MKSERPTRLIDSLSDFGKTIVSSYLNEHNITIMPIILKYADKIPKDSGEYSLLSIGCRIIDTNWAIMVPEINTVELLTISDLRR